MSRCPDLITWQDLVDGEAPDADTLHKHLESCPECRETVSELRRLATFTDSLALTDALPAGFTERLFSREQRKVSFHGGVLAAVLFALLFISTLLLDPGVFTWWLSVGITRHSAWFMDAFLNLVFLQEALQSPGWWGMAVLLLFTAVYLLNKLYIAGE